ncbi:unnamed protein product [Ectocarpus sp. 12 AP-2014]
MVGGVSYDKITADGLEMTLQDGTSDVFACDTIVLCAGQTSNRTLAEALEGLGTKVHVIGGADVAAELDAKRAIDQGARLAAQL